MCLCHYMSKDRRNSEKYVFMSLTVKEQKTFRKVCVHVLPVKGQKTFRKVCVHVITCQKTEEIQKSMCSCHYLSKDRRNSEMYVFMLLPVKE